MGVSDIRTLNVTIINYKIWGHNYGIDGLFFLKTEDIVPKLNILRMWAIIIKKKNGFMVFTNKRNFRDYLIQCWGNGGWQEQSIIKDDMSS